MKRFLSILAVCLFLFTTTGFTVTKHYCGDKLISVAVDAMPSTCGMNGGCCHNESEFYQLKEDVTLAQSLVLYHSFSFNIQLFLNDLFLLNPTEKNTSSFDLKTKIPPPNLSIFLAEIQSFRL